MKLSKFVFSACLLFVSNNILFDELQAQQTCSADSADSIKIYIPGSYTDSLGGTQYSFESRSGSEFVKGYAGYKGSYEDDGILYRRANYGTLEVFEVYIDGQWNNTSQYTLGGFKGYDEDGNFSNDTYVIFDITGVGGTSNQVVYTYENDTSSPIVETGFEIVSDTRIEKYRPWTEFPWMGPGGIERIYIDNSWELSDKISLSAALDDLTPEDPAIVPESTRRTATLTSVSPATATAGNSVSALVTGRSSKFSYTWTPPSCGDWELKGVYWRWKNSENESDGSTFTGELIDYEENDAGELVIKNETVPAKNGYSTKFLYIEAKKNCSNGEAGESIAGLNSLIFNVALGALNSEEGAGALGFNEDTILQACYTPLVLRYAERPGVEVVSHQVDNAIRQIVAPQAFVDVIRPSSGLATNYDDTTAYTTGDEVLYQNYVYVSLQSSNLGNNPVSEATYWTRKAPAWGGTGNTYSLGDQVWYQNTVWEVTATSTTEEPTTSSTDWNAVYAPSEFEIRFYRSDDYETTPDPVTNIYSVKSGRTPFVTYKIENPNPLATQPDELRIVETRGSTTKNILWTQTGDDWTFSEDDGIRVTELIQSAEYDPNAAVGTTRTERRKIKDSAAVVASDVLETYEMFPWGEELVSSALDPDGVNRVTTYYYHDEVIVSPNYAKLKMEVGPFGNWSYYVYDSSNRRIKTISQYGNQVAPSGDALPYAVNEANNRVIEYAFDLDADSSWDVNEGELKLTVERVLGNEVGRSFRIEHTDRTIGRAAKYDVAIKKTTYINCTSPGADWDDPTNLVTVNEEIDNLNLKGRLYSVEGSDGIVTLYGYTYDDTSEATKEHLITTKQVGIYTGNPAVFSPFTTEEEIVDELGYLVERRVIEHENGNDILVDLQVVVTNDANTGKPTLISYLDGTTESMQYACCGLDWSISRDGTYTAYTYDGLGRVTDILQGEINTHYDLDAVGRRITETISNGSSSIVTSKTYNLAGEMTASTDALGRITTYSTDTETISSEVFVRDRTSFSHNSGEQPVWAETSLAYQDGSTYRITGPSVIDQRYEYTFPGSGMQATKEISLLSDLSDSAEYTTTVYDIGGRVLYVRQPAIAAGSTSEAETEYSYNSKGQLEWVEDATGIKTYYVYDSQGRQWKSYIADDTNGPVQTTLTTYATASWDPSKSVQKTVSLNGVNVSEEQTVENALDDGLKTVVTINGVTSESVTTITDAVPDTGSGYTPAIKTVTTTVKDSSNNQIAKTIEVYHDNRLQSRSEKDTAGNTLTEITNGYDELGRLITVTQAGNTTTYTYSANGQIATLTTPDPDTASSAAGDEPQTTTYLHTYAADGTRTTQITLPDANIQTETYYATGQLKNRQGARTYKVEYTYDYAGRTETQKTWQDVASSAPAITKWSYNAQGLLKEKFYAYDLANPSAPADLSYSYDDAGRLIKRANARSIETTYSIDPTYGYQTGVAYSDSTPSITYAQFDRSGRATQITDASGTRTLTYTGGQLDTETYAATGTPFANMSIDRSYDTANRYNGISILNLPSGAAYNTNYVFDSITGRFHNVSFSDGSSTHTATYNYKPQTQLIERLVQNNGTVDILNLQKSYDALSRLKSIAYNQPHQDLSISYQYNAANQRIYARHGNGEYWLYGYDALGQVVSARKHLADNTPIPGYWFTYGFDDIGNREKAGRDQNSAREKVYNSAGALSGATGANQLNQYGSVQIPRLVGVLGKADTAATITVNGQTATRTGEHFQALVDYSGQASPDNARYETINILGALPGAGAGGVDALAEASDDFYLPANPVEITHDADGNLTADGRWNYTWNGENRLIAMETHSAAYAVGVPRQKLEFAYDSQGRRFSKKAYSWSGSVWQLEQEENYLYDGWNLITVLESIQSSPLSLKSTHIWGLDLSGTLQGAGGVGGLLATTDSSGSTFYPAYDGNGNIMGYYNATSAASAAEYEYGPFGELIRATGPQADEMNFRFSTKFMDTQSSLYYYGYRYYNSDTGRWLNKDPIEERGGLNLYAFIQNDGVNDFDYLGLYPTRVPTPDDFLKSEGEKWRHPSRDNWDDFDVNALDENPNETYDVVSRVDRKSLRYKVVKGQHKFTPKKDSKCKGEWVVVRRTYELAGIEGPKDWLGRLGPQTHCIYQETVVIQCVCHGIGQFETIVRNRVKLEGPCQPYLPSAPGDYPRPPNEGGGSHPALPPELPSPPSPGNPGGQNPSPGNPGGGNPIG